MATEGTLLRLKKLALIEDASPDNVVNLIPVTEDAEGSALFGVTNEAGNLTIGAGQLYLNRANPELSVICLKPDSSDVTQIESWVDNQTDIYVSGLTIDGGILIGDRETSTGAVKLVANEQLSDNDVYAFNIKKTATPRFDPTTGIYQNGFWVGKNLIGGYEWADADGDGIADGWTNSNFSFDSFSSGSQSIRNSQGGSLREFKREIYIPFEDEKITFSLNFGTINDGTSDYSTNIDITFFDSSDSTISTITTSVSSIGRESVSGDIPSNTVYARCRLRSVYNSGTDDAVYEISDPALKLGTDATYTTF